MHLCHGAWGRIKLSSSDDFFNLYFLNSGSLPNSALYWKEPVPDRKALLNLKPDAGEIRWVESEKTMYIFTGNVWCATEISNVDYPVPVIWGDKDDANHIEV